MVKNEQLEKEIAALNKILDENIIEFKKFIADNPNPDISTQNLAQSKAANYVGNITGYINQFTLNEFRFLLYLGTSPKCSKLSSLLSGYIPQE